MADSALQCAVCAGPAGPAFSFLLVLAFPANLFLSKNEIGFLAPGVDRCPRIRPHLAHAGPTGPVWGFRGVVPLPSPQNRTRGHTVFLSSALYLLYFSPTGKSWSDLAPVLLRVVWIRPQPGHSGPAGRATRFAGVVFPTWPPKTHTGSHRGEFGVTSFSWGVSAPAALPSPSPACNLLPPG